MSKTIVEFVRPVEPQLESYWRGLILFGSNSATYKFALGRALLELAQTGKTFVTLEELAEPYSRHLTHHLQKGKRQGTSASSQFLKGLEDYNVGKITHDQMLEITVRLGFTNVIDAFHNLQGIEVPRFYVDERKTANGIQLTDELMNIVNAAQSSNLVYETEARWSLVETAWELGISPSLLLVKYDVSGQALFVMDKSLRRVDITSARDALNGYQKGKCFYCFSDVDLTNQTIHVDHVFPHMLKSIFRATKIDINLDGVWNLVLACQRCNLSKSDQRPHKKYIERLFTRNEFFISSHHPLRETLINQTGSTSKERQTFLSALFNELATTGKTQNWVAPEEYPAVF